MIKIHEKIEKQVIKAKMLLQVHDELVFEIEDNETKKAIPQIKSIMENTHKNYRNFQVPLVVDYEIGNNWGGLK